MNMKISIFLNTQDTELTKPITTAIITIKHRTGMVTYRIRVSSKGRAGLGLSVGVEVGIVVGTNNELEAVESDIEGFPIELLVGVSNDVVRVR